MRRAQIALDHDLLSTMMIDEEHGLQLNRAPVQETLAAYHNTRVADPYALADLDDFFWPHTRWWALEDEQGVTASAILIEHLYATPILYAVAPKEDAPTLELLSLIAPELPSRLFALLPPNAAHVMASYQFSDIAMMLRMLLEQIPTDHSDIASMGPTQEQAIKAFLATAYTDEETDVRLFESYMLERWPHVACVEAGEIVAFGGTHVLTTQYAAAAIGNIVTRPDKRGGGRASRVTEALCARLWALGIRHIGLNVAEANLAARRCYDRLGFVEKLRFIECSLTRRGSELSVEPTSGNVTL